MNELEKQIEERADQIEDLDLDCDSKAYLEGFWEGANFILEKNLPVLFADWKEENENEEALHDLFFESNQEIYDYWLNNVYGK